MAVRQCDGAGCRHRRAAPGADIPLRPCSNRTSPVLKRVDVALTLQASRVTALVLQALSVIHFGFCLSDATKAMNTSLNAIIC